MQKEWEEANIIQGIIQMKLSFFPRKKGTFEFSCPDSKGEINYTSFS